jgi:hypothetical protein
MPLLSSGGARYARENRGRRRSRRRNDGRASFRRNARESAQKPSRFVRGVGVGDVGTSPANQRPSAAGRTSEPPGHASYTVRNRPKTEPLSEESESRTTPSDGPRPWVPRPRETRPTVEVHATPLDETPKRRSRVPVSSAGSPHSSRSPAASGPSATRRRRSPGERDGGPDRAVGHAPTDRGAVPEPNGVVPRGPEDPARTPGRTDRGDGRLVR